MLKIRKTDFLSLENDVNGPSKSNKQKNEEKLLFFVDVSKVTGENSRFWSRFQIR
jgi:hypothetical protein